MSYQIKGELVLIVLDRGLTVCDGKIPLRSLILTEQSGGARESLLGSHDVPAGMADAIADALWQKGIAVEDVCEPLPGLEKPEAPKPRRTRRKPKEDPDGTAKAST